MRIESFIDRTRLTRALAIAMSAGAFLALVGPFGSDQVPLASRLIYFPLLSISGTLFGIVTGAAVKRLVRFDGRWPFMSAALTALVMTPPSILAVYALTRWIFGWGVPGGTLWGLGGPVLLVCLAMTCINALADRQPIQTHAKSLSASPEAAFLNRLPPKLRGAELYAVTAEDHYLRLHTAAGSDLILMRLSDAIAELDGLEGAQTHRSWWVARNAVLAARRADGRAVLELPGGIEAPVSRTYARALRSLGWF